ncbi:MAG: HAMP domain-containing sensor histidine kinase [Saprospiraceae bacterium]|nr:HAMP domain-containing sensor histidine kinase [Saprospiraceae bacterium]MDZ4704326.1 HAMP domain-containing sensor histidine kinase [Saprospiraceae bacterium]
MKQNIQLRLLSYGVIAYMMMAFAWWSVLLFVKNNDAFEAKRDLLRIGMVAEGLVANDAEFYQTPRYIELARQYYRQEWMIVGEASVFIVSLVIGIWLINRGYHREVMAAQQRRNFLLSITHELKSPIASIKLVLETLLKRQLTKEQSDKISQSALRESDRLNDLVNDLLLSARLETAYQPYTEELDLSALLRDLIQKLQEKYPKVAFLLKEDAPVGLVRADKSGITSVALNLLENAVKYSPESPKIEMRLMRHNGTITWEVTDNGIGIEDKEKVRVFEKFYRIGNEDTRQTKGTGLGLFIVKEVVRAHGGNIVIVNNQPKGSVFRVILPV